MSNPTERADRAYAEGYEAAMAGESFLACHYKGHQGSPTRIEALAWRKGYQAAEGAEAEGHHFRSAGH